MFRIRKYIEQLEEAAEQLSKWTPTGARLSLMLLDNLVELLMYERVRRIFAFDDLPKTIIPPEYSRQKRKKVLDGFDEKVNFLVSEDRGIEQDEGDVLKIGHQLRNEAYHTGVVRETIITCVTAFYFETVCRLIPRLWLGELTISDPKEVTAFLATYGLQGEWHLSREDLAKVCELLLVGRTHQVSELCKVLSDDLARRIQELIESLEYVSPSGPEELLKELQFYQMLSDKKVSTGWVGGYAETQELLMQYRPPVTMDRISRWRQGAFTLESERKPGLALRKFAEFDRYLLPLESMVGEAVSHYEMMIDAQIHP